MSSAAIAVDATIEPRAGELPPNAIRTKHGGYLIPFGPNNPGNPSGRSKRFHEVMQAAQEKSLQAIEKLGLLMNCGDERVELMASTAILDRAFGKPKEQKTEDAQGLKPNLAALSPEDLAALRAIALKLASAMVQG